jgi:hypothetical protein
LSLGRACFFGSCANSLRGPHQRANLELGRAVRLSMRLSCTNVFDPLPCYDLRREVCSVVLFCMRPCLNPSLRGRPRTVVHVRARALQRPTPIKSIRSSCGTPRRSIIRNTPGHTARSRGHIELAKSRRDSLAIRGESTPSHSRICFSQEVLVRATLQVTWAEDRATVGTECERGARARRGMRVGPAAHPCSLRLRAIPL